MSAMIWSICTLGLNIGVLLPTGLFVIVLSALARTGYTSMKANKERIENAKNELNNIKAKQDKNMNEDNSDDI